MRTLLDKYTLILGAVFTACVFSAGVSAQVPNRAAQAMSQMPLVIPLFLQDEHFSGTLVMVNGSNVDTYADIVLTATDGRQIVQQRASFTPHSRREIEIYDLLQSAVSPATSGRIEIMLNPSAPTVLGQLSMTYQGAYQPTYIDEEIAMPSVSSSQILRAVAQPSRGSPVVAITSLSGSLQHVTIDCLKFAREKLSKSVAIGPGETFVTSACTANPVAGRDLATVFAGVGEETEDAIGIALTSDASPGSFAAFGFSSHRKRGDLYYTGIAFADPLAARSTTIVFTGVPVGSVPLLGGGAYMPELALANFSTKDLQATVKYARGSGSDSVIEDVANLVVPAGNTRSMSLNDLLGDSALESSFLVTSNGSSGDIAASLVARNAAALREVELLGKDQLDAHNGGSHPWSLENGTDSTLLLFNPTSQSQTFTVAIQSGKVLWQKAYELAPMATEALAIRALIDSQVRDQSNQTLPKNILSGEVGWFTPGPINGKGRILESNSNSAMARNFSCGSGYVLCNASFVSQAPDTLAGGGNVTFGNLTAVICYNGTSELGDCTGTVAYYGDNYYSYSWSSTQPTIASVKSWALNGSADYVTIQGDQGGTARINGQISDNVDECYAYGGGPVKVQVPTSLSIVTGTSSTTAEASCKTSGGLTGCGVTRTFTYQVNDQNGDPIAINNMTVGDVICTTSTNQLNLVGYVTTCGGTTGECSGTAGPCGKYTNASGQFPEMLTICAPACYSSGKCSTAGQTIANQTWTVAGHQLNSDVKSISYQCNKILVNGA